MRALAALRSIVGEDQAREAEPADAIDEVRPAVVARPGTVEEVSAVLGLASREGWSVAPRGSGTKLRLGNAPARLDLVLELGRLDRVLEHGAGDLVVSVEAGVRLDSLQATLSGAGQMLGLDPPHFGATVGGIVAANASGPRRLRYGTVRDLLIGITVVLADGTVAKAGGKVVKNVAGYDLAKLMAGSLGTLGVIVRTIFRLHPLPTSTRLVEAELESVDDVRSAGQRVVQSNLVPSALQLAWDGDERPRVGVLFEGVEPSAAGQAAQAAAILREIAEPAIHADDEAVSRWRGFAAEPVPNDAVEIRISCLPASTADAVGAVRQAAAGLGVGWRLSGMLGTGVLLLRLADTDPAAVAGLVTELRGRVQPGTVVVLAGPAAAKKDLDVWGPVGDSLQLMRRVKDQFDPDHLLNPGRFVGGI